MQDSDIHVSCGRFTAAWEWHKHGDGGTESIVRSIVSTQLERERVCVDTCRYRFVDLFTPGGQTRYLHSSHVYCAQSVVRSVYIIAAVGRVVAVCICFSELDMRKASSSASSRQAFSGKPKTRKQFRQRIMLLSKRQLASSSNFNLGLATIPEVEGDTETVEDMPQAGEELMTEVVNMSAPSGTRDISGSARKVRAIH